MIRQSRHLLRLLSAGLTALLAAGAAGGTLHHAASPPKAQGTGESESRATIDPEPPLSLFVEMVTLQKHPRGGIASLRFDLSASVGIAEAVLTAKAPAGLVFADGSTLKTWNVDLSAGGTRSVPVDVIVPEDGKYVISADVAGTARGNPIRRGAAGRLLVGVREPAPKTRHGAIEYPASQAEGA